MISFTNVSIIEIMPSIEKACQRFFNDSKWLPKLILGSIITFIPGINVLALGYLYRLAKETKMREDLPEWNRWGNLFIEGIQCLILFLAFFVLPIFLTWVLSQLLTFLSLGILGLIAFFPITIGLLVAPSLFVAALFYFQSHGENWSALLDFQTWAAPLLQKWPSLLIINILVMGLITIGLPLFGFTFFIGFIFLIDYCSLLLKDQFH